MPTCTPENLSDLAKCFTCLTPQQKAVIDTYLLAVSAGGSLDPATLYEAAKCFSCLNPAQMRAIQTYLLCQIANAAPVPPGETDGLIWGPNPETVSTMNGAFDLVVGNFFTMFPPDPPAFYTEFSFGNPVTVTGNIDFSGGGSYTSLEFRKLITVLGGVNINGAAVGGLVELLFPLLVNIGLDIDIADNPAFTTFSAPLWLPTDGTLIYFSGCDLDATSVELILRRCVLAGVTTCTIDLSGGTNAGTASLSAQGQADVATLGAQVTMNP